MDDHIMRTPISCHFRDCKALLITSLTRVSGAVTSVQTFTFTLLVTSEIILEHFSLRVKSVHNNDM